MFRPKRPLRLDDRLPAAGIFTCLPIVQEVLQGIRDDTAHRAMRETLLAFRLVESPLSLALVEEAAGLYRAARHAGLTVKSSADCVIAACALRHDLTVVHRDRKYPLLAKVSQLTTRRI